MNSQLRTSILNSIIRSGVILAVVMTFVSGCSILESYQKPPASKIPHIPEIKKPIVVKPKSKSSRITSKSYILPRKKPKTIVSTSKNVLSQKERIIAREVLKQKRIKEATVEKDPYADIPSSNETSRVEQNKAIVLNPAVNTLVIAARSDLALGRSQTAISKLERGLRIAPNNDQLWYLLAKSHFAQGDFQQTINMAKKSISYSENTSLIAENYNLMKRAGEKSGNSLAIKEALDYLKVNP